MKKNYKDNKQTIAFENEAREDDLCIMSRANGDIIENLPANTVSVTINKMKKLEGESGQDMIEENDFIIRPSRVLHELHKYLSSPEYTLTTLLSEYVTFNTCFLTQDGTEDGEFCSLQWMAEDLDYKYNYLAKLMNSLFRKGIISIVKVTNDYGRDVQKVYIMNPFIYRKGKLVDTTTMNLFKNAWHPSEMPTINGGHYRRRKRSDRRFDNRKIIVLDRFDKAANE